MWRIGRFPPFKLCLGLVETVHEPEDPGLVPYGEPPVAENLMGDLLFQFKGSEPSVDAQFERFDGGKRPRMGRDFRVAAWGTFPRLEKARHGDMAGKGNPLRPGRGFDFKEAFGGENKAAAEVMEAAVQVQLNECDRNLFLFEKGTDNPLEFRWNMVMWGRHSETPRMRSHLQTIRRFSLSLATPDKR